MPEIICMLCDNPIKKDLYTSGCPMPRTGRFVAGFLSGRGELIDVHLEIGNSSETKRKTNNGKTLFDAPVCLSCAFECSTFMSESIKKISIP